MSSRREPFTYKGYNARFYTRKTCGKFNVIDTAKATALRYRLILPGDAKEIARRNFPETDAVEFFLNIIRDQVGILQLCKR